MRIVRQPRPARFETLDRRLLQDERLSFRARGLLCYLLSLPDGWETDSTKLSRVAREGRDAIRAALRELEACGYLGHLIVQDRESGKWRTETTVRDIPETGFQASENQASENQALLPKTNTEHEHRRQTPPADLRTKTNPAVTRESRIGVGS